MKTLFRRVWSDPVWSKVIASVILVAAPSATWYFWPKLSEWAIRLFTFLAETTEVANWLLYILYTLSFIAVVVPVIFFIMLIRQHKSQPNPIKDYLSDEFLGMTWRWRYSADRGIYGARPFCPYCDFQIYPGDASTYRFIPITSFQCDHCHRLDTTIEGSFSDIEGKVERLIQLKLRNGEWSNAPKPGSSAGQRSD